MKTLQDIRDEIVELQDEAQAVINVAETEDRDLSADEKSRVDSILNTIGENGERPSGLRADESRLEKLETEKKRIALARNVSTSVPAPAQIVNVKPPQYRGNLRAFKGQDAVKNAYHAGMWLKATLTGDSEAKRIVADYGINNVQTEGTNSAGGFTVADPLSSAILDVREDSGVSRQICDVVQMPSDTLAVPKRSAGLTVYYPGESGAITASDMTFAQVSLSAVKRGTLTQISNELLRDSVVNIADRVASEAGLALALKEDNELIQDDGTGSSGVTGILSSMHADQKHTLDSGEVAWSAFALSDLHSIVGKLPAKYHPGAVWLMRRDFYSQVVQKLMYAAGGNTTANIGGATVDALFGKRIYFTDQMDAEAADKCAVLFGDFTNSVIIGSRDQVDIATSSDYAFNQDVLTLRSTVRYDIAVHDAGSGGGLVGAFTAAS
jgi:HK97 family phage major capsid protein